VKKVKAKTLTVTEFSTFGHLLSGREAQFVPAEGFAYGLTLADLPMSEHLCAGLLVCEHRRAVVSKLERHVKTAEILVALEGDSLLCVAAGAGEKDALAARAAAFYVPQGEALVMHPGTWHWIPFPVGVAGSRFLVVFRKGTGEDDLDYAELFEPFEIAG
jgi:ureidoglycolate hydrolase